MIKLYKYLFIIISVNLFYDFFVDILIPTESVFSMMRGGINLLFIFYILTKKNIFKPFRILSIFAFYILFLVLFSSNIEKSINLYLKIFSSLFLLPVSYYFITSINDIKTINKNFIFSATILLIYLIVCQTFKIGEDQYGSNMFFSGNITGSSWNVVSYFISILPLIFVIEPIKTKRFAFFIAIALFVFLILSVKRTSLIGALIAFVLYYRKNLINFSTNILAFFMIISVVTSIIFLDTIFNKQIEAREDQLEEEGLEKEGRYKETTLIWENAFSFDNLKESFFGKEIFNSTGNFDTDKSNEYMIHVDYNTFLHGSGIIGLFIYIIMYLEIILVYKKYESRLKNKNNLTKTLKLVFYIFIINSLLFSVSGQMYNFTFRAIGFIYIGGILGYTKNLYLKEKEHERIYNIIK